MSNPTPTAPTPTPATTDGLSGWDTLRRVADQLELEVHLGGMELRERWRSLKPRIEELQRKIVKAGADAGHSLAKEIAALAEDLRGVRDGIDRPDS